MKPKGHLIRLIRILHTHLKTSIVIFGAIIVVHNYRTLVNKNPFGACAIFRHVYSVTQSWTSIALAQTLVNQNQE